MFRHFCLLLDIGPKDACFLLKLEFVVYVPQRIMYRLIFRLHHQSQTFLFRFFISLPFKIIP